MLLKFRLLQSGAGETYQAKFLCAIFMYERHGQHMNYLPTSGYFFKIRVPFQTSNGDNTSKYKAEGNILAPLI